MLFTRRPKQQKPSLKLGDTNIEVVQQFKFLGVIFDSRLTFAAHIDYLKAKCNKALNLLRVVAHLDWGADKTVLLRLYQALIRSKLDYGCVVYGSASKTQLEKLDVIQNQALRLALGAFRTSPVNSLHVEANETPLCLRRQKLSLQYSLKLRSNSKNPAAKCVNNTEHAPMFENKPGHTKPLDLRVSPEELGINPCNIANLKLSDSPPWTLKTPEVLLELSKSKKADINPCTLLGDYQMILDRYPNHTPVYTDGSKIEETVAAAAVCGRHQSDARLPDRSSIFSAELTAINLAFDIIRSSQETNFIIFTDSLSSLQAIAGKKT